MNEIPIYQDDEIQVTNLRAILAGKTYAMSNVTSVAMFTQTASSLPGVLLAVVGGCFTLLGFDADLRSCALILGVPLLLIGIALAVAAKDRYWVRIGGASGETNALSSLDRDYILRVVAALNEAIVRRG